MDTITEKAPLNQAFILDNEGLRKLFSEKFIYPVLLTGMPSNEARTMYFAWMKHMRLTFSKDELPWVPVGLVGPCPMIGHYDPTDCNCHFPYEISQRVLLRESDYFRILRAIEPDSNKPLVFKPSSASESIGKHFSAPNVHTPIDFVNYSLNSLLLDDASRTVLEELKNSKEIITESFPTAYLHASRKLTGMHYSIIDLKNILIEDILDQIIPEAICRTYNCIAFLKTGKILFVATSKYPTKSLGQALIERLKGNIDDIYFCYTDKEAITNKRQELQRLRAYKSSNPIKSKANETAGIFFLDETRVAQIDPNKEENSAEELFEWLLIEGVAQEASDIHLEQWKSRGRVRIRIDGDLKIVIEPTLTQSRALVTVAKNAFSMGSNTFDTEDAALTIAIGDQKIGLRASVIPFRKSHQNMVIRILPKSNNVVRLDQLGTTDENIQIIKRAVTRKQGLILITGPTGEGKTTTLYAALSEVNKEHVKIQTIEDPIEKEIDGLIQTAVDVKREITFPKLMRSIVRQDPNIILLGEIRDQETAELAIEAADTGHLVLSTLHSNSALKSVKRLLQLGIEPFKLSDSLLLLQAQRLIKRLCQNCKAIRELEPQEKEIFKKANIEIPKNIYEAKGCESCSKSGYLNRIVIMELIPVDSTFAQAIASGKSSFELAKLAEGRGYKTLYQDALLKVAAGETSIKEAKIMEEAW